MSEATQAPAPAEPTRPKGRREEKRIPVTLTEKAKAGILEGNVVKGPGDVLTPVYRYAKDLVQEGLAVLADVASAVFPPAPKRQSKPEAPRLDQPSYERPNEVEVLPKRSVFRVNRSYGPGTVLYLTAEDARIELAARNIKLADGATLPPAAAAAPARPSAALPISKYGCANMGGLERAEPV